jgi:hypothetical protein
LDGFSGHAGPTSTGLYPFQVPGDAFRGTTKLPAPPTIMKNMLAALVLFHASAQLLGGSHGRSIACFRNDSLGSRVAVVSERAGGL